MDIEHRDYYYRFSKPLQCIQILSTYFPSNEPIDGEEGEGKNFQSILQFGGMKLNVRMRLYKKFESFGRVENMNGFGNYGNPQKYKDKYDKFHLIHVCFSSFLWMLKNFNCL